MGGVCVRTNPISTVLSPGFLSRWPQSCCYLEALSRRLRWTQRGEKRSPFLRTWNTLLSIWWKDRDTHRALPLTDAAVFSEQLEIDAGYVPHTMCTSQTFMRTTDWETVHCSVCVNTMRKHTHTNTLKSGFNFINLYRKRGEELDWVLKEILKFMEQKVPGWLLLGGI